MRIAVLSDIHGNVLALNAVLADLASRLVDATVNLGDVVAGPLWSAETAALLMACDFPTILGNQDRRMTALAPVQMNASERMAAEGLNRAQRAWLGGLPSTLVLGDGVLLVHGTPTDDTVYLVETVSETGARPGTDAEILRRLGGRDERIVLCGHSHLPSVRTLNGRLVVNPGSVGLQAYDDDLPHPHRMEAGTPHARYCVIDTASLAVEEIEVAYDWEAAAAKAEGVGRGDWAVALRTGRAR